MGYRLCDVSMVCQPDSCLEGSLEGGDFLRFIAQLDRSLARLEGHEGREAVWPGQAHAQFLGILTSTVIMSFIESFLLKERTLETMLVDDECVVLKGRVILAIILGQPFIGRKASGAKI